MNNSGIFAGEKTPDVQTDKNDFDLIFSSEFDTSLDDDNDLFSESNQSSPEFQFHFDLHSILKTDTINDNEKNDTKVTEYHEADNEAFQRLFDFNSGHISEHIANEYITKHSQPLFTASDSLDPRDLYIRNPFTSDKETQHTKSFTHSSLEQLSKASLQGTEKLIFYPPLKPLILGNALNYKMIQLPHIIQTQKPNKIAKRSSKISKIARPQRKHIKFEYDLKCNEELRIVFNGGFIRQNVIRWYFPDFENGEFCLPDNWKQVTVGFDENFYDKITQLAHRMIQCNPGVENIRTYWKMTKVVVGSHFAVSISEESLDCEPMFTDTQYYFNVISAIVEPGSFGPIERGARNREKITRDIKRDEAEYGRRWCHFLTSSEMKGIFDFFLVNYDYCANDHTIIEKLRAGIKPDPFKHHESRIRSHMLGYISGKSCKLNATKLEGIPRQFSEKMYHQIMSYNDHKRPYNTTKDISVMEVKYMFENLVDLLEKYYWVDPATVPPGGYNMLS